VWLQFGLFVWYRGDTPMIEPSRVTVAYVDSESGELMKFRCSTDNVHAARRVSSFLRYSEQEQRLKHLQVERQKLVKSQSLQGRSAAECDERKRIESELRKFVDNHFSLEKLESDGKVCEEAVSLDFVCGIEAFAQTPFSGISISRAKSLVEVVEERAQFKLYRKKYPEDVEWRANKAVNSLVDDLLKKKCRRCSHGDSILSRRIGFRGRWKLARCWTARHATKRL
jgi:hypothetical protein